MDVDIFDNIRFRKLLLGYPSKAISFLYEKYYLSLIRISLGFTHHQAASEDIVQEAFVHVWENHRELGQHHERSIQHYMVKVVKNRSITFYQRNLRLNEYKKTYLNGSMQHAVSPSVEVTMIDLEMNNEIRAVIATFPKREKECLLMKIDGDLSTEEIADTLNVTKKAVERSLTSANKRLRSVYASKKEDSGLSPL